MRRVLRWVFGLGLALALLVLVVAGGVAAYGYHVLQASLPALKGTRALTGLGAPVTVARDAGGVPAITGGSRTDLARALGFLHGQERFFQMDLLRRDGAGELAALVGPGALPVDRLHRVHRFRARAAAILAAMPAADRGLLDAYVAGVNAGLAALGHAPWEYTLLRQAPAPWTAADTLLVVDAMYFDLQASGPAGQLQRAAAEAALGPAMADFLFPRSTAEDAPIDGSVIPEPPIPDTGARPAAGPAPAPAPAPAEHGSNNFAVAGRLTGTGAAMLENDMHLALRVPNIWFRARMTIPGKLDLNGVTLPGTPFLVAGSNGRVAWGFTDSYTETGDAVVLQMLPGDPPRYATPSGPQPIETQHESLCAAGGGCQDFPVRETIWGPIEGTDAQGRPVAWRWVAHDPNSIRIGGMLGLEQAQDVASALAAAHEAGIPAENLLVADAAGHIAWTIIGQVPRHHGLEAGIPQSWADGQHGWDGYLAPAEVPVVRDPGSGRLWSANARVVGGAALALLGDGGYAWGARAQKIRNDLLARPSFSERDLLAIATDAEAAVLVPWQKLMLEAIAAHPQYGSLRPAVEAWGGRALPESVGYRLVRRFELASVRLIYAGLTQPLGEEIRLPGSAPRPAERLLEARPGWVPAPFHSWDELTGRALARVLTEVQSTKGGLAGFTWGAVNRTGIGNPLAAFVPGLRALTDPPDVPVAGDSIVPRVAIPGFGASERMVVSPGHEASGILEMPAGQSDNPLSPYYLAGEADWVDGRPAPLLPGPARWTLTLTP